jgi:hypothetical protein
MVLARRGARLLSDGFREALPALIHFSTAATWHLIHQAGTVLLDVETQRQADDRRIALVGQLAIKSRQKLEPPVSQSSNNFQRADNFCTKAKPPKRFARRGAS